MKQPRICPGQGFADDFTFEIPINFLMEVNIYIGFRTLKMICAQYGFACLC